MAHILFVDDEESVRVTLAMMLESKGFKVTTAATVAEALGLISRGKFDGLIADLNIGQAGDALIAITDICGNHRRTTERNSKPDIWGIFRSEITMAGSLLFNCKSASKPLPAVLTS